MLDRHGLSCQYELACVNYDTRHMGKFCGKLHMDIRQCEYGIVSWEVHQAYFDRRMMEYRVVVTYTHRVETRV
jgi:hypothetical protein